MNKKKTGDPLSRLGRMLQQPRQAFLAFGAVSLVVAGAGVAFKYLNDERPLSASGFGEGSPATLERPAEIQADSGIDSTDMATFGERPKTLKEVGQAAAETEQAQAQAEKTPLTEFPTVDPSKLDLKGQGGGGGGGGSSASAPALGGPFERLSSAAGRAFNSSKAFLRSFGGSSRQAGSGKGQASSVSAAGGQILDKSAKDLGAKSAVLSGNRGTPVTSQSGYPVAGGGNSIDGAGAGLGQGPKESKGSGGGSGGSSGGGGGSNAPATSSTTAGGTNVGNEDQFVVTTDTAGLQRQCFCVRPTGSALRPYEIMKPNSAPSMCDQVEYKVTDEETAFKQLLNCEDYNKCTETMSSLDEKHRAQVKKEELAAFDKKRADAYYTCWEKDIVSTSTTNGTLTDASTDTKKSTDDGTTGDKSTATDDPTKDGSADVVKSSETIKAEDKVAEKCKYDFFGWLGIVSDGCLKAKQQQEAANTPGETEKEIVNNKLADAEENLEEAKAAKEKACRSSQQGPHGVGKILDSKACEEAKAAVAEAQKERDEAFIEMRAYEKVVNESLVAAEKDRNDARIAKDKACASGQQGPHGVGGKPKDPKACEELKTAFTTAQQKVDDLKNERPSGCKADSSWGILGGLITPSECYYAWRDDVFGPKENTGTPIQKVMAAEKELEDAQRAKNTACAMSGGRGNQKVINQEACDKAKVALAAVEKKVKDVKKELYGCLVDTPWMSIVECGRITIDGAQAKLRGEDKIAYKSGDKTNESKESVGKDEKTNAEKAIAEGRYTDCRRLPNAPGDKTLQYRCKETATGKEVSVSNAVYAAFFRSQKDKKKETEITQESGASNKNTEEKKEKTTNVKSLSWSVRTTLDFANNMIDDLKNGKKWPSSKLNKYNKDYDEKLKIKYDEQMKLANALKRNPGGNPAEVAGSLKLQSDWAQFEREALKLKENQSKTTTQSIVKADTKNGGSNKTMTVVDQNGKKMDATQTSGQATSCNRSQGFVVLQKSGVSYCQQVPKTSKTLARIQDSGSVTGYKIVQQCPKNQPFKTTNWAGTGSGECLKETSNKVSNANHILEMYQQSRNSTQAKNDSRNPQKKCRKIEGTRCVP